MMRITWRLRDLPTAEGLAALIVAGGITIEEARFIMFGITNEKKEEIK